MALNAVKEGAYSTLNLHIMNIVFYVDVPEEKENVKVVYFNLF